MKRKILCMILSIAVVISFMPFFTLQADAFSTGSTTLLKTRTVTIQPGKTYKAPVIKLKKKRTFQVPITIKVSPKSKRSQITKGGYTLSIKHNGKIIDRYKCNLKYVGKDDELAYTDWIYYFKKSISKPCYDKGKYYFSIKNTSNCAIKVKFSVKGYTKFASNAEFVENKTVDYNSDSNDFKYFGMIPYVYVGRIGPGVPALDPDYFIKSSNEEVYVDFWHLTHDGKLYINIDTDVEKEADTVVSIKLRNNSEPYKINFKVIGSTVYDEEDEDEFED